MHGWTEDIGSPLRESSGFVTDVVKVGTVKRRMLGVQMSSRSCC